MKFLRAGGVRLELLPGVGVLDRHGVRICALLSCVVGRTVSMTTKKSYQNHDSSYSPLTTAIKDLPSSSRRCSFFSMPITDGWLRESLSVIDCRWRFTLFSWSS